MIDALRPFIARLIAVGASWFFGWLLVHWGVDVDRDTQQQLVESLVDFVVPGMLVVYAVVHKLLNKLFNPGDAASTHLAVVEKVETANIKKLS